MAHGRTLALESFTNLQLGLSHLTLVKVISIVLSEILFIVLWVYPWPFNFSLQHGHRIGLFNLKTSLTFLSSAKIADLIEVSWLSNK